MPSEPIAVTDVLAELNTYWNVSNVVKPQLIEMTGDTDSIRIDLNRGDYLIGRPGSPTLEETPVGNWKYVNRLYNVVVDIQTKQNRQRLYDLMREIRKVCHARASSLTNFQRIQFMSFTELTAEQVNLWSGTISLQLQNFAVTLETT